MPRRSSRLEDEKGPERIGTQMQRYTYLQLCLHALLWILHTVNHRHEDSEPSSRLKAVIISTYQTTRDIREQSPDLLSAYERPETRVGSQGCNHKSPSFTSTWVQPGYVILSVQPISAVSLGPRPIYFTSRSSNPSHSRLLGAMSWVAKTIYPPCVSSLCLLAPFAKSRLCEKDI
ncbi:hypothetical protein BDZ97DRAFT_511866 [Flammula alnicola]|nr:hypothetical protein BDZ97DRAFT_511866 [Flammula alnicola]